MKSFLIKTVGFLLLILVTAGNASAQKHYTKVVPKNEEVATIKGPPPGKNYVWKTGNWRWNDGRYAWNPGSWAQPPFTGARWITGRWVNTRFGWYWVNGRWGRRPK